MMIDKRLLKAVPESLKYVLSTVLFRWLSLISNAVLVFCVAHLIRTKGENFLIPTILIAASIVVTFLCSFFSSITSFKSSCNVKKNLRSMIYKKLLQLGPEYQEKTETAKIVQLAVEGVEQLEVWFGSYLPQFFYSMIAAVTLFLILAFFNLKMALILLICVPLIPLSIVLVQKIAKRILAKYWGQYANLADNFLENLQGLTTLQIYRADEYKQQKMAQEAEHFRKVTMKVLSMQLNSIIVMDIVAYAGAGLAITAALGAYFAGSLNLENCFICILLSADFFIPLRRLGSYFHTAMNGTTAANKIFDLLGVTPHSVESGSCSNSSPLSQNPSGCGVTATIPNAVYELKDVNYKFNQRQVLSNINLSINKGEYIAFVGKSGSGKSTTAKILCGINREYQGQVLLYGKELNSYERETLYSKCMYISHRDWIFKGSIQDCLLEGNPNATKEQMWQALEKVQLADFVKEEGGLEMQIKENASNLSGGQKQRLSIARALIHDSEILIFDEATSNIDVESELAILNLLHKLKSTKTIIMISHRKENAVGADRVYSFEDGKITSILENKDGGSK